MVNGNYKIKDVKVSIHYNTWLQDLNLSLELITELVYFWLQHFSNSTIQHKLNIFLQTIKEWLAYLQDVCYYTVMQESKQIGGLGIHVEIDESKFGKRKYYRGKRMKGQWYLVVEKLMTSQRFSWYPSRREMPKLYYLSLKSS